MIIDLQKFIDEQRPAWNRLERRLDMLENNPERRMSLDEIKDFHGLYQRASADLARIASFSSEESMRRYLETLVARAYAEIYESRSKDRKISMTKWFLRTFPRTFRKHINAFWASLIITLIGAGFGGAALGLDSEAKQVIMPFSHVLTDPSDRVSEEESSVNDDLEGSKAYFSSYLMTHNIKVSIMTMAMGVTWGIGTIILLFYNGVILGAVAVDYILAGETAFLLGWLTPHGSVEIPSILIAGQAGFLIASAILGRNSPYGLKQRLRLISGDVVTLVLGLSVLLIWAGIIESFFSQYHEPVLPYWLKMSFGFAQFILLCAFLGRFGKKAPETDNA